MIAAAGLMVAGSALAADIPAAGKAKCGACHNVEKKVVGPSFNDIAAKYKGDKDAVAKLIAAIDKGGDLGWKTNIKMPAKGGGASDAVVKEMAEFIAGLAK